MKRIFAGIRIGCLVCLLIAGCAPPKGSIPAESIMGSPLESIQVSRPCDADNSRLVAYRMTHRIFQKVAAQRYIDITASSYQSTLMAQRNYKQDVTAQRIFYLWGPAEAIVQVLEEGSAVMANLAFADLSDVLWIPQPMPDRIFLPAVRDLYARQIEADPEEPMYWICLNVTVKTRPQQYDKWVEVLASTCRMVPEESGRWKMLPPDSDQIDRIRKALETKLVPEKSSVFVSAADPLPEPVLCALTDRSEKRPLRRLSTPAGEMLCLLSDQGREYHRLGVGLIQIQSQESMPDETQLLHRTVIDELVIRDDDPLEKVQPAGQ